MVQNLWRLRAYGLCITNSEPADITVSIYRHGTCQVLERPQGTAGGFERNRAMGMPGGACTVISIH